MPPSVSKSIFLTPEAAGFSHSYLQPGVPPAAILAHHVLLSPARGAVSVSSSVLYWCFHTLSSLMDMSRMYLEIKSSVKSYLYPLRNIWQWKYSSEKGKWTHSCGHAHFFPVSLLDTVGLLHLFLLFWALQGHDISSFSCTFHFPVSGDAATVKCKIIFMYLLQRKERRERKKKNNKGARSFFYKTEIRTRLLLIKDWWGGICCLQEKTFVKTIDIGSFW